MFRQFAALLVPLAIIGTAYMYHEQKRNNYNELKLRLEEERKHKMNEVQRTLNNHEETQLRKLRGACTWVKCMS